MSVTNLFESGKLNRKESIVYTVKRNQYVRVFDEIEDQPLWLDGCKVRRSCVGCTLQLAECYAEHPRRGVSRWSKVEC